MKFRKKPIVVDAWQFTSNDVPQWIEDRSQWQAISFSFKDDGSPDLLHIATLEGVFTAERGDWVIRGVDDEIYPCKKSIFEQTYELVG